MTISKTQRQARHLSPCPLPTPGPSPTPTSPLRKYRAGAQMARKRVNARGDGANVVSSRRARRLPARLSTWQLPTAPGAFALRGNPPPLRRACVGRVLSGEIAL